MTADATKTHWERVYREKRPEETSWHQEEPRVSLELIADSGLALDAPLIDVGGGASRLVDHLLARGYGDLTVLDISRAALDRVRTRLGQAVALIESDVTAFVPGRRYRFWHDRAAFHFLTAATDRRNYVDALARALEPGGGLLIAAFAPDGPVRCSGLEVVRYEAAALEKAVGPEFRLEKTVWEIHLTPQGREQSFGYHFFRRRG